MRTSEPTRQPSGCLRCTVYAGHRRTRNSSTRGLRTLRGAIQASKRLRRPTSPVTGPGGSPPRCSVPSSAALEPSPAATKRTSPQTGRIVGEGRSICLKGGSCRTRNALYCSPPHETWRYASQAPLRALPRPRAHQESPSMRPSAPSHALLPLREHAGAASDTRSRIWLERT